MKVNGNLRKLIKYKTLIKIILAGVMSGAFYSILMLVAWLWPEYARDPRHWAAGCAVFMATALAPRWVDGILGED